MFFPSPQSILIGYNQDGCLMISLPVDRLKENPRRGNTDHSPLTDFLLGRALQNPILMHFPIL